MYCVLLGKIMFHYPNETRGDVSAVWRTPGCGRLCPVSSPARCQPKHRVLCFCCGFLWCPPQQVAGAGLQQQQRRPDGRACCCSVLVQSKEHISFDIRLNNENSVQVCTNETTWRLLAPDGFPQRFQCYLKERQCFCAVGCFMALGNCNSGCAS